MIIGRITSGFGNQLFQYAIARHLALGAWLNPDSDKLVIAPRQWYKNQPTWNTKDLLPSTWLAL